MMLVTGCEKEPVEISGDATLKIINNCSFSVSIYFDNDFIGKVEEDATRTWSVPSGEHEVRASSLYGSPATENPTFSTGQTVTITLTTTKNKSGNNDPFLINTEQAVANMPAYTIM